jgi:hypothetical protein
MYFDDHPPPHFHVITRKYERIALLQDFVRMDPPDFVGMGPPDFGVMDPPDFVPMGPPAGAAFRPERRV